MRFGIPLIALFLTTVPASAQLAIRPDVHLSPLRLNSPVPEERPVSVDNSRLPYFPDIISQHGGSCAQASAIHYLFTYEMNRVLERAVEGKDANTFSYRYIWHFLNDGGNNGGFSSDGIEITRTAGCMTVSDYGSELDNYYRWPSGYAKYYNAMHYRTRRMYTVDLSTRQGIETLMDYMADKHDGHPGGGLAGFSLTGDWSIDDYDGPSETGLKDIIVLRGSGGAHAMTFVGYDQSVEYDCNRDGVIQDNEKGAFILVNSWGTWWGTDGFAYMPFSYYLNAADEGGLSQNDRSALCIETEYREPGIAMGVKLNYTSRNDLILRFGVADGAQATEPAPGTVLDCPIVRAQGGDLMMQGTYFDSAKNIEMGFDLSAAKAAADTMKAPCWFLTVIKIISGKPGEGYVSEVSLHDYSSGKDSTITRQFDEVSGKISMTKNFKVPTRPWFKNAYGEWYEPVRTSANPLAESADNMKAYSWRNIYGIRRSDGGYAKVKVRNYDSGSRRITLDIANYE
ncbi:MAG: hypothetical protein MJY66_04335 [Bacteroidaceae bacterium]|nr:hypothetical protein [Bacteroidaceae bacterium]